MSCTFLGFTGSQEVGTGLLSSETLNCFVSVLTGAPCGSCDDPHFPNEKLVLGLHQAAQSPYKVQP